MLECYDFAVKTPLKITDTILRDAHQSQAATRMTIDDIMDTAGLPLTGIVLEDPHVTLAAAFSLPLLQYSSRCDAAKACRRIAKRLQGFHQSIPFR